MSDSDDNTIFWTKDYLLKWEDFLGVPNFQKPFKAESNVGLDTEHELEYIKTKSKIKFKFKNFKVRAIFLKATSWKKDDIIKERLPYVLNHEQGHFDISQEYVDFAYKSLHNAFDSKTYSVKGRTEDEIAKNSRYLSDVMAKAVMDKVFAEHHSTQLKYESETKYGTNDDKQREYDDRFKKLRK